MIPLRVLVAGSTGYLGQHVVRELHARGHQVRTLVRSPAKLDPVRDSVDETHQADATDPLWPVKAGLVLLRWLTPLRTHQLIEFPLTVLTRDVLAPTTGAVTISPNTSNRPPFPAPRSASASELRLACGQ